MVSTVVAAEGRLWVGSLGTSCGDIACSLCYVSVSFLAPPTDKKIIIGAEMATLACLCVRSVGYNVNSC